MSKNSYIKTHWPERALEKALARDFPGCKSALEALKSISKDRGAAQVSRRGKPVNQEDPPVVASPDWLPAFQSAIDAIAEISIGVDVDKLEPKLKFELDQMPITNEAEVEAWKQAWIKALISLAW